MKAVMYTKYGSPDVLQLKEVDKPVPKDDEVLIKVHAASINSWDWDMLPGRTLEYRLPSGILRPKKTKILGCDIAGRIETVGRNIKQFHPGDDVFGDLCKGFGGGFAEDVCARERELTLKPAGMTYEEAAAAPQAGLLALQGLCDKREIKPGQKMLINGAGGGVGTFAIQMAKSFGAEVTGADSTGKLDMMSSPGADYVCELFKSGKLKPVVDRCFPLGETARAFQYYGEGHFKGKAVITVEHNENA
jgi:NADPH:quinone reductase-like Zn-dependent oxidoreductase